MNTLEFLKEKRFNLVNKQKEIKNTLSALSMIGQPEDIIMLKLILNEVKRLRKTYNFLICNYDVIKTLILY
jgi:superfamily I DNA/RNA helicase